MDEIAGESPGMRDPLLVGVSTPDDAEVEQLFVDHHRRLRGLAAAVTFDQSVADEIVQDAFAKFLETGSDVRNPVGYLQRSVINLSITHVRRRNRARRLPTRRVEPAMNPDIDGIWGVLEKLTARQRAVVVMRFYEDQTYDQIAETLEIPVGSVKSTLHRALSALEEKL